MASDPGIGTIRKGLAPSIDRRNVPSINDQESRARVPLPFKVDRVTIESPRQVHGFDAKLVQAL